MMAKVLASLVAVGIFMIAWRALDIMSGQVKKR